MGADIYLEDKFVKIKGSGPGNVIIDGDNELIKAGRISIDGEKGKILVYFPAPAKGRQKKPADPVSKKPLDLTRDLVEEILNLREYVKDLYNNAKLPIPPDLE